MTSSHELRISADPALPVRGRWAVPPWVIAAFGAALVLAGLVYFIVRVRRGRLRR